MLSCILYSISPVNFFSKVHGLLAYDVSVEWVENLVGYLESVGCLEPKERPKRNYRVEIAIRLDDWGQVPVIDERRTDGNSLTLG